MEEEVKLVGPDDELDIREEKEELGMTSIPGFLIVQLSWCQVRFLNAFEK